MAQDFSDNLGNMINAELVITVEETNLVDIHSVEGKETSSEINVYPNPFNSKINISFALSQQSPVSIEIFDILGKRVRVLKEGYENAGVQQVSWDGRNSNGKQVSSGVYFCKLRLNSQEQVVKVHFLQ